MQPCLGVASTCTPAPSSSGAPLPLPPAPSRPAAPPGPRHVEAQLHPAALPAARLVVGLHRLEEQRDVEQSGVHDVGEELPLVVLVSQHGAPELADRPNVHGVEAELDEPEPVRLGDQTEPAAASCTAPARPAKASPSQRSLPLSIATPSARTSIITGSPAASARAAARSTSLTTASRPPV